MSQIGIVGLGNLGMPIAKNLYNSGFDVVSYSKSLHPTDWYHTNDAESFLRKSKNFTDVILAAGVSRPAFSDLESDLRLSLDLADKILNNSNVSRFFYFSTGAVYGECESHRSEVDEVNPITPYGILKSEIERKLVFALGNRVTQLRIGNVYGHSQKSGLLSILKRSLTTNERVAIVTPTESRRDYMLEDYFVESLAAIIGSETYYPIINVGSGRSLSIFEIVDIFITSGGNAPAVESVTLSPNDVLNTQLNNELLSSIYRPHENVQLAISDYFRTTSKSSPLGL